MAARAVSDELVEGVGSVVVEFFDIGVSRRWSWPDRPDAAALLAAAADPRATNRVVALPGDVLGVDGKWVLACYRAA